MGEDLEIIFYMVLGLEERFWGLGGGVEVGGGGRILWRVRPPSKSRGSLKNGLPHRGGHRFLRLHSLEAVPSPGGVSDPFFLGEEEALGDGTPLGGSPIRDSARLDSADVQHAGIVLVAQVSEVAAARPLMI